MKMNSESISSKYSNKKDVKVKMLSILVVLCLAYLFLAPGVLKASDDVVQKAREALTNLAKQGDLLSLCTQYAGMTPKGGCTEADQAGKGLVCPTTTTAGPGAPTTCHASVISVLEGNASIGALLKLGGTTLNTAEIYATITPINSVSHTHQTCSETTGECAPEYIKRKDSVEFKLAIWNSSKVSVGIKDDGFNAQVNASEGFLLEFTDKICGWKQHGEPRHCEESEPVPVEGVGTETVHGDEDGNPGLIPFLQFLLFL